MTMTMMVRQWESEKNESEEDVCDDMRMILCNDDDSWHVIVVVIRLLLFAVHDLTKQKLFFITFHSLAAVCVCFPFLIFSLAFRNIARKSSSLTSFALSQLCVSFSF